MNGPQHYAEAERLVTLNRDAVTIAAAQVHATLALAAATIEPILVADLGSSLSAEWSEATS